MCNAMFVISLYVKNCVSIMLGKQKLIIKVEFYVSESIFLQYKFFQPVIVIKLKNIKVMLNVCVHAVCCHSAAYPSVSSYLPLKKG